jgi:hypothetical protein
MKGYIRNGKGSKRERSRGDFTFLEALCFVEIVGECTQWAFEGQCWSDIHQ